MASLWPRVELSRRLSLPHARIPRGEGGSGEAAESARRYTTVHPNLPHTTLTASPPPSPPLPRRRRRSRPHARRRRRCSAHVWPRWAGSRRHVPVRLLVFAFYRTAKIRISVIRCPANQSALPGGSAGQSGSLHHQSEDTTQDRRQSEAPHVSPAGRLPLRPRDNKREPIRKFLQREVAGWPQTVKYDENKNHFPAANGGAKGK